MSASNGATGGVGARKVRAVLALAATTVAVLCFAAPSAVAKSDIDITLAPDAGSRGVVVSAFGGDDAAGRQRLCLQQSRGAGWRTLVCGKVRLGTGGRVRAVVPSAGRAARFRAVLQRMGRVPGSPPVTDVTSAPVGLRAAGPSGQRQANSKSEVSLSSVDNGIDTASVVRSK